MFTLNSNQVILFIIVCTKSFGLSHQIKMQFSCSLQDSFATYKQDVPMYFKVFSLYFNK